MEEGFHPQRNRVMESLFSLGNGHMGVRGHFEEDYSGDTLPVTYLGGLYYPESVPAPHSKIGLPSKVMRVPHGANTLGIHVELDGETLDLAHCTLRSFRRTLSLREGVSERRFRARLHSGKEIEVQIRRFCSMADKELAVVHYALVPLNFSGTLTLTPYIDLNLANDRSHGDNFPWVEVATQVRRTHAYLVAETRSTEFQVCFGMKFTIERGGEVIDFNSYRITREKYVACSVDLSCHEGEEIALCKYTANLSSLHHPKEGLLERCKRRVKQAAKRGSEALLDAHRAAWAAVWEACDLVVEDDVPLQQGLRFNLFHLFQAYSGDDPRISLSPRGFTGKCYGGGTSWSTDIFGLPFFLSAADAAPARNLLEFRYRQLPQAIENARRLGFEKGAALYPMVTINGEESSTAWEVALEGVHRNGAVAYALFHYVQYTGDRSFLLEAGLEMLIGIARFWAQRVHYSEKSERYVLHGVTGPNEFENNVNNNWYTNYLLRWCLRYAIEVWRWAREADPEGFRQLAERIRFYEYTETKQWQQIIDRLYLPGDSEEGILPQQDGFLDKPLEPVSRLSPDIRPLRQHWSWDRILRSAYVQRADVLQGLFLFADHFEEGTLRRNFEFYEPLTVHESSLSPASHAILAARLGKLDLAYAYLLHSARLDLDDRYHDTADGCHVTSMAGTWLAMTYGLAGFRVREGLPSFDPVIPRHWNGYRMQFQFREWSLRVEVKQGTIRVKNGADQPLDVYLLGQKHRVAGGGTVKTPFIN